MFSQRRISNFLGVITQSFHWTNNSRFGWVDLDSEVWPAHHTTLMRITHDRCMHNNRTHRHRRWHEQWPLQDSQAAVVSGQSVRPGCCCCCCCCWISRYYIAADVVSRDWLSVAWLSRLLSSSLSVLVVCRWLTHRLPLCLSLSLLRWLILAPAADYSAWTSRTVSTTGPWLRARFIKRRQLFNP